MLTMKELEKRIIVARLKQLGGSVTKTARSLGLGRATIYRKIIEHGIDDVLEPNPRRIAMRRVVAMRVARKEARQLMTKTP